MPVHPSRAQSKRAEFVAEDLADAVENYLSATDKQWIDGGPITEARKRLVDLVKYIRTGEGTP